MRWWIGKSNVRTGTFIYFITTVTSKHTIVLHHRLRIHVSKISKWVATNDLFFSLQEKKTVTPPSAWALCEIFSLHIHTYPAHIYLHNTLTVIKTTNRWCSVEVSQRVVAALTWVRFPALPVLQCGLVARICRSQRWNSHLSADKAGVRFPALEFPFVSS